MHFHNHSHSHGHTWHNMNSGHFIYLVYSRKWIKTCFMVIADMSMDVPDDSEDERLPEVGVALGLTTKMKIISTIINRRSSQKRI